MDLVLNQLADSVSTANSLEGLTRPLLELLESVTGLESTYLTTIDEREGVQNILFSRNSQQLQIPEGLSVPWGDTLCKRALTENRPYTADVAGCWGDSEAAKALGIRTYLSQPVRRFDGQLYGTLCAASGRSIEVPAPALKVLGLFARLIEHQIEREQLLKKLQAANAELSSSALTDALTGVANRRALMQDLQRLLDRSRRDRQPVRVAFIDLDGFKQINDRHGHENGDAFLIEVARRLASGTRPGDVLGRYGGDEFVVAAVNIGADVLRQRLEQLTAGRYQLHGESLDYAGASVGVVSSGDADTDAAALLARADAAMYEVKRARHAGG
ncbi:MAG: sensor domain-containing diguanylate cyclase [Nevskiaceae bacterium]|nr:MAG: sensor domain-containing diguanylate cyclase [Nevskiaceae bacterium]